MNSSIIKSPLCGLLAAGALLFYPALPARADVSIGIGIEMPGVNIGINMPAYPQMEEVPGYPVYYNPQAGSNYFFYDGQYWVYQNDNWYMGSWYNGPWETVDPQEVPLYVLRVPVHYYGQPPAYFMGWNNDAPPRWGDQWGRGWAGRHQGWDQWDHGAAPRPAPLPDYQRSYSGGNYPQHGQQQALRQQNYHYQAREAVTRSAQRRQQAPQQQGGQQAQQQHAGPQAQHTPQHMRQQASLGHLPQAGSRQPVSDQGHGQSGEQRPPQSRQPSQQAYRQQPEQYHQQPQQEQQRVQQAQVQHGQQAQHGQQGKPAPKRAPEQEGEHEQR